MGGLLADLRITDFQNNSFIEEIKRCLRHVNCSSRMHVRSIWETKSQNGKFRGWRREVLRNAPQFNRGSQACRPVDRRQHIGRGKLPRGVPRLYASDLRIEA